jgi:predicted phosphodiesterase
MRLAILADIHGNVAALEAVLADAGRRGAIDLTVNLGDCVSGPLWPSETCRLLMQAHWPTVRGNHDRAVAFDDPAAMWSSDAFAHGKLDAAQRAWLGSLPVTADVAPGVFAFHGQPGYDTRYLLEDIAGGRLVAATPAKVAARIGETAMSKRLVLCGHSHQPRLLQVPGGPLVVNPGSVGNPAYDDDHGKPHVSESGSPHARYAIAELTETGGIAVDLIAVTYDHGSAARRANANGRPEWAHALTTGFMARRAG